MNAREIERLQEKAASAVDLESRIAALEAKLAALEVLMAPVAISQLEVVRVEHEVEPIVMERGTPKRSSNRTVGKKR